MTPSGFQALRDESIYRGHVIEVVQGHFRAPDGADFTRDVIRHPGAVGVVPLHEDGTVTLVRQYRSPVDAELLEIPAGLRDVADEPLEVTAERELAEEVGLAASKLEPLVTFHAAPGHSDEVVHVFVATGLSAVPTAQHGPEELHMTIERHPLADLGAMIGNGTLTDAKTVLAVALLQGRA